MAFAVPSMTPSLFWPTEFASNDDAFGTVAKITIYSTYVKTKLLQFALQYFNSAP